MILIHLLISYTVSPPLYLAIYCSKLSISTFANRGNIWCWRWKNRIWTDGEASWMNQITSTLCVDGMYFKQWMRKSKSETCTFNSSNRIWSARVCVFLYIYRYTTHLQWMKMETQSTSFRWQKILSPLPNQKRRLQHQHEYFDNQNIKSTSPEVVS